MYLLTYQKGNLIINYKHDDLDSIRNKCEELLESNENKNNILNNFFSDIYTEYEIKICNGDNKECVCENLKVIDISKEDDEDSLNFCDIIIHKGNILYNITTDKLPKREIMEYIHTQLSNYLEEDSINKIKNKVYKNRLFFKKLDKNFLIYIRIYN